MAFVLTDTRPPTTGIRPRKTKTQTFAIMAALALVALLILLPPNWPNRSPGAKALPDDIGYVGAVDEMAMLGLFRIEEYPRANQPPLRIVRPRWDAAAFNGPALADCRTRLERLKLSLWFTADKRGQCRARFMQYLKDSYLEYDMRQIEQWRLEPRSVLGLVSHAHMLAGAGGLNAAWLGEIRYSRLFPRGGQDWDSAEDRLLLTMVGNSMPVFTFQRSTAARATTLNALLSGEVSGAEGQAIELRLGRNDERSLLGNSVLAIRQLGRAVLVEVPPRLGTVNVYVDGRREAGNGSGNSDMNVPDFLLVRPQQTLGVEDSATGRAILMQLSEAPGLISGVAGNRRLRESTLYDAAQWLELAGVEKGNYTSSIIAPLHFGLQRLLEQEMLRPNEGQAPPASFRAAALLMDGMSGEIAAAATFPAETSHLAPADRENPDRLEWLHRNFNFEPLTIGSTAKVVFAAAVAQQYPDLLRVTIPWHARFSRIRGHRVGGRGGMANAIPRPEGTPTGFVDFLKYSNNQYVMEIATQALERDRARRLWNSRSSWVANLWRFGCVVPYSLSSPDVLRNNREFRRGTDYGWRTSASDCSPYLWRDASGAPLGTAPHPVERVQLGMASFENDFADFYQSLIGGSRGLWTAANLSQAYARIFTDRRVSPRLLFAAGAREPATLGIRTEVWRAILAGTREVLEPGGTAGALGQGALAKLPGAGQTVWFYAKTGTLNTEVPFKSVGHALVLAAVRTTTGHAPALPSDICSLRILTINLQRSEPSALRLAGAVFEDDPAFRQWLLAPCPTTHKGGR
jgi:hypothetical protein